MNKGKSTLLTATAAVLYSGIIAASLFSGSANATVYTVDTFKNPQSVVSSSNAALTKDLQIASPVVVTGVTLPGTVTSIAPSGSITGSVIRTIGVNQQTNGWGNNGIIGVNPTASVYGVSKIGALGFNSNNGYQYDAFGLPLPASYETSYDFGNQGVDNTSWIEFDINGVCVKPMTVNVFAPNGAVAQLAIPQSVSGVLRTLRLPITAFNHTASGYPTVPMTSISGFRMTWTSGGDFAKFQLFEVRMNTLGAAPLQCATRAPVVI